MISNIYVIRVICGPNSAYKPRGAGRQHIAWGVDPRGTGRSKVVQMPPKKKQKKSKKTGATKLRKPLPEKPPKTEIPDTVYDRKKSRKQWKQEIDQEP